MSTNGCWHKFSSNGHPQLGVRWRQKTSTKNSTVKTAQLWHSSVLLQLKNEAAQLWKSTAYWWPWDQAALWLSSSALCSLLLLPPSRLLVQSVSLCSCPGKTSFCFIVTGSAPAGEMQSSVFGEKGKYSQRIADI